MAPRRVVFLVAALLAVLAVAPWGASAASDVLDLKKADFQDTIKKEDIILVEVRLHRSHAVPPEALLPPTSRIERQGHSALRVQTLF
jgi:hypothetical protein